MVTTIGYIFGITLVSTYIYMAFISRTMSEKRYKFRIIISGVNLVFALILGYSKIFVEPFEIFVLCGLAPFIYLGYYEILRRLLKHLIGEYPYAPHWDKIGDKVRAKGYPQNRYVVPNDRIFGFLMFMVPFLTIIIIIIMIDK
jgi:hypothetical protein